MFSSFVHRFSLSVPSAYTTSCPSTSTFSSSSKTDSNTPSTCPSKEATGSPFSFKCNSSLTPTTTSFYENEFKPLKNATCFGGHQIPKSGNKNVVDLAIQSMQLKNLLWGFENNLINLQSSLH